MSSQTVTEPTITVEPVEEYLQLGICEVKLALYQPVFDLLKVNEQFTYLDSLNLIVANVNNDSFQDKLDQIHDTCIDILTRLIGEFDIVINTTSLKLLTQIYHALTLLDVYEESSYIINICNDESLDQTEKLYQLLCLIHKVDEQEYYNSVNVVALSLIDKVKEVHSQYNEQTDDMEAKEIDMDKVKLIRAVAVKHPQLMMVDLVSQKAIVPDMSVTNITDIIHSHFEDYEEKDAKHIALQLVAIYLLSDTPLEQLQTAIKGELPKLFSDDKLVMTIASNISPVFVEVMNYVKA